MDIEQGEQITLSNGREYLCFAKIQDGEKKYIFMMSSDEPAEIRFGEQLIDEGGGVNVRIVEDKDEKLRLLEIFKEEFQKQQEQNGSGN